MQIYQIFVPELHANVKFKVLPNTEVEEFLKKNKTTVNKDLRKDILQYIVFNLNTDVASSLNMMSRQAAERALEAIYAGCIMLNPGLDIDYWINIAYSTAPLDPTVDEDQLNIDSIKNFIRTASAKTAKKKPAATTKPARKLTKDKFLGLEHYLGSNVIGQDEAIGEIVSTLFRSQAEMHDPNRPLGVFLFAGSSGVGKTHLAATLHKYMFGDDPMVRMDCGEFQLKHEPKTAWIPSWIRWS